MRTISLEDHFLSAAFHEALSGGQTVQCGANDMSITQRDAQRQAKLLDLGEQRLRDMDAGDMDAGGVDVQVISHTAEMAQLAPRSARAPDPPGER